MEKPSSLIRQAADERARLIQLVVGLSEVQSNYKPNDQSVRKGKPIWQGEHANRGLSIEEVVARTWKSKEVAPPLVAPRFGGPASYWVENLRLSQHLLERLEPVLEGLPIESVIFPHFLSGPLDAGQRIDFLRFHMVRHRGQIENILAHANFPAA